MIKRIETSFQKRRINELGLFSLDKTMAEGVTVAVYKHFGEVNTRKGEELFPLNGNAATTANIYIN